MWSTPADRTWSQRREGTPARSAGERDPMITSTSGSASVFASNEGSAVTSITSRVVDSARTRSTVSGRISASRMRRIRATIPCGWASGAGEPGRRPGSGRHVLLVPFVLDMAEPEPVDEPGEKPGRPPVPPAHQTHRRGHEQDAHDRRVDGDGDRHPDADALDGDDLGEREGGEDRDHDERRSRDDPG